MSEFKRWISYIYSYNGEIKGKNTGFAKIEARDGRCRISIGMKGAYGCDETGLDVGLYVRRDSRPVRISVGKMRIQGGCGEFSTVTKEDNLFETGICLNDSGGLWLTGRGKETFYLTSWEKGCLEIRDFLPQMVQSEKTESAVSPQVSDRPCIYVSAAAVKEAAPAVEEAAPAVGEEALQVDKEVKKPSLQVIDVARKEPDLETLPKPELWESLCRYYPKTAPELLSRGVELLQIRPADIRYLPRRLWHLGSNSFLLHGYYRYKYLVLGRIKSAGDQDYILGVKGINSDRERFSADLFGFHSFLPLEADEQEGYWYTQITL